MTDVSVTDHLEVTTDGYEWVMEIDLQDATEAAAPPASTGRIACSPEDARGAELAQLIKDSDSAAFEEFMGLTGRLVNRILCAKGVANRTDREDLLQETFAVFWAKRDHWRQAEAVGYLVGIAKLQAVKYRSARARRLDVLVKDPEVGERLNADPGPGPEELLLGAEDAVEAARTYQGALASLPPHLRDVLVARVRGLQPIQIASVLGISLLQVWDRTYEALAAVKRAAGVSDLNPALEEQMKGAGLWPNEARPLPMDMGVVVRRLSRQIRIAIYAKLSERRITQALQAWGMKPPNYYNYLGTAKRTLQAIASGFGVVPASDDLLTYWDLWAVFGVKMYTVAREAGVTWHNRRRDVGGYLRADFPALWAAAERYQLPNES